MLSADYAQNGLPGAPWYYPTFASHPQGKLHSVYEVAPLCTPGLSPAAYPTVPPCPS